MKKISAILVVIAVFAALALPVSANSANGQNLGSVPKTNVPIVIDGEKEEVYNSGLKIPVTFANEGKNGAGGGTAYMLWDENNLYVFCEVTVKDFIRPYMYDKFWQGAKTTNDGWTDTQMSFFWMLNSCEVWLDLWDEGDEAKIMQFNTSPYYDTWNEVVLKDKNGESLGKFVSWTENTVYEVAGSSAPYLTTFAKIVDDTHYNVEWQFKLDKLAAGNIAPSGINNEGKKIGLTFSFTESFECSFFSEEFYDPEDGHLIFNFDWSQGSYDTDNYWPVQGVSIYDFESYPWVTLGAVTDATTYTEPAAPEPEQPAQGDAETAETEPAPAAAPAETPPASAKTGDVGIYVTLFIFILAAAAVKTFKPANIHYKE